MIQSEIMESKTDNQIQITGAMLRAGQEVLDESVYLPWYVAGSSGEELVIWEIFEAMLNAA